MVQTFIQDNKILTGLVYPMNVTVSGDRSLKEFEKPSPSPAVASSSPSNPSWTGSLPATPSTTRDVSNSASSGAPAQSQPIHTINNITDSSAFEFELGKWYHIGLSFAAPQERKGDRRGLMLLYVDGQLVTFASACSFDVAILHCSRPACSVTCSQTSRPAR
jgi:hypothetical protein